MGDLEALRSLHPDWTITVNWVTVPSGPDRRRFVAWRGDVTVSGDSENALAASIALAERSQDIPGRS